VVVKDGRQELYSAECASPIELKVLDTAVCQPKLDEPESGVGTTPPYSAEAPHT